MEAVLKLLCILMLFVSLQPAYKLCFKELHVGLYFRRREEVRLLLGCCSKLYLF